MSKISIPFVSVIIPVYNDPERLKICLQALEEQTYHRSSYEIIVVDNGSDESIEPIVAEFTQAEASFEPHPGSYATRNKGLSLARGEVIGFTDSDCIPATDWIEKGVKNLLRVPNCGIIGGRIDLFFQDPDHPTAVELFDKYIMNFEQSKNIEENSFSVTANLFTFKCIVEHVGGFDSELKSRGDVEWGHRVVSFGYTLNYADDVCVAHPARRSFAQLRQRMIRLTGGFEDLSRKNSSLLLKHDRQEFSLSLIPSLRTFLQIWQNQQLTLADKVKVTLIGAAVKYVKVQEKLRLKLRGKSAR